MLNFFSKILWSTNNLEVHFYVLKVCRLSKLPLVFDLYYIVVRGHWLHD